MLSLDTNILLFASDELNPNFVQATIFTESLKERDDVAISEFVLTELYVLLRNPAVLAKPRTPAEAVRICMEWRHHPRWQVLGFTGESRKFHDTFWPRLAEPGFARRRAFDWKLALTLMQQGVHEFATLNVKDFEGFGFKRVWNPLKP